MPIPCELIDEILHRVPVKYLLRCRCVSKEWCSLIDSDAFIKKHFKRTTECNPDGGVVICGDAKVFLTDLESLRDDNVDVVELNDNVVSGATVVGVANGLVCLCDDKMNEFVLCNPSTRKYRKLPSVSNVSVHLDNSVSDFEVGGFGYDRVNDDYKVVKIVKCETCSAMIVIVYSLKSNSWKQIYFSWSNDEVILLPEPGKFVGEALYWMAVNLTTDCLHIFGFDLGLEEFKKVPIPDVNGNVWMVHVGGFLCISDTYKNSRIDVWLMNNLGAENPWCKAFSVEQSSGFRTFDEVSHVAFSNSGKDVLLEVDEKTLLWYDLEKKAVKNVGIHGIPVKFYTCLYTESLLQLTEV